MATRKPVRVLPEPVGEATRTSLPAAMWGQAADWGGVGPAGNRRANQLATAGWKSESGEASGTAGGTAPAPLLSHREGVTAAPALSPRRSRRPPVPVRRREGGGPSRR